MINPSEKTITEDEETDALTYLSFEAWDFDNENQEKESALWEKFYQEQKHIILKNQINR